MKVKKQIKKFQKLEKRLIAFVNGIAQVPDLSQEETVLFQEEQKSIVEKRQKTLKKIFNYALAH